MPHISQSGRRARGSTGFTIVEILVVVSIFTLLLTLLLPVVNNAREGSRRTSCASNQARLASAMARYNAAKGVLPSLADQIPLVTAAGGFRASNWFQVTLPYLEHSDIYARLQQNIASTPALPEILCPSGLSTARQTNWTCYGVSTGSTGYPWDGGIGIDTTVRRSSDDIRERDGLTNTLLTADKVGRTIGSHNDWENWSGGAFGSLGFRQWNVNGWITGAGGPNIINRIDLPQGETPARSLHPGGTMATFFDGRVKFVKEDIPMHIYAHLITSYSVWNGSTYNYSGSPNSGTAHYNLRCITAAAAVEPVRVQETDY